MNGKRQSDVRYTPISGGRTVLVEQIKLIVLLSLTGCILLGLETTALGRISLSALGMGRAAPSLGILFCMASGFLFDERVGGGFGLIVGFLADSMDYSREGIYIMLLPLLYFLFGYLSGIAGKRRLAHNLPSFVVFSIIGGGVECLVGIARATVTGRTIPPPSWIYVSLLPVWILTVLFSPVVYGIIYGERRLLGRTGERRGRGERRERPKGLF